MELDRVETATDAKLLCELTATYIWRDPRELNPVFEVLFEEKSRTLRRVRDLATSDPSDAEKFPLRNDFSSDVIKALSTLRNEFQACYFRIEEKTASFQSIMNIILSTIVRTRGITRDQVRFDRLSFMRKDRRAAAFRYVLVGNQVQEAIISIARSAQRKGQSDQRSHLIRVRLRDEFEDGNAHMPKASIGIEFSNLPSKYASADAFLAMRPLLSEYYQVTELATELSVPSVQRYINEFDEYVVSLRLRLYQGGD